MVDSCQYIKKLQNFAVAGVGGASCIKKSFLQCINGVDLLLHQKLNQGNSLRVNDRLRGLETRVARCASLHARPGKIQQRRSACCTRGVFQNISCQLSLRLFISILAVGTFLTVRCCNSWPVRARAVAGSWLTGLSERATLSLLG